MSLKHLAPRLSKRHPDRQKANWGNVSIFDSGCGMGLGSDRYMFHFGNVCRQKNPFPPGNAKGSGIDDGSGHGS